MLCQLGRFASCAFFSLNLFFEHTPCTPCDLSTDLSTIGSRLSLTRRRHHSIEMKIQLHSVCPSTLSSVAAPTYLLLQRPSTRSSTSPSLLLDQPLTLVLSESCVSVHELQFPFLPVCSVSVFAYMYSVQSVPDLDPVC